MLIPYPVKACPAMHSGRAKMEQNNFYFMLVFFHIIAYYRYILYIVNSGFCNYLWGVTYIKKKNKFINKKLFFISFLLTFIFLSANVLNIGTINLLSRQPVSIVVQAKGFSSGGFKSGGFSSGKSSGGGLFGGSGSSGSKSYSYGGSHSSYTFIPIHFSSWGWHSSHYGTASALGAAAGAVIRFIIFIVVAVVIYNIIKKSRRY